MICLLTIIQVVKGKREWLNGPAIRNDDPGQFCEIGNQIDTAQVHPYKFTCTLLEKAKERGNLTLRENTVVIGLQKDGNSVIGVKLEGGEVVYADDVILACGPWSKTVVSKWMNEDLGKNLERHVIPEKYYSIIIEPSEENKPKIPGAALFLKNTSPVAKLSEPEVYPRPNGLVFVCGCEEVVPLPDDPSTISTTVREHIKVNIFILCNYCVL